MAEETLVTATPETPQANAAAAPAAEKPAAEVVKEFVETEEKTLLGDEQKPEEKKDGEPVAAVVPEKYEVKLPEGMAMDEGLLAAVSPVFKELKLNQEQAQKLVDAYAPYVKAQAENQKAEALKGFKEVVNGWKEESQKELGAEATKKLAVAAKAINKFGTPALRELLNETGVGNNKEMINFFIKVGSLVSEDHFAEPNKQTTSGPDDLSVLYPTMKK